MERDVKRRWRAAGTGTRYDTVRWSDARRRTRDPRVVRELLDVSGSERALVLDAPAGTGRLRPVLDGLGRYVGLEISAEMLLRARSLEPTASYLCGDVEHLPFRDGAFDAVVCCRLLHHLDARAALERVLAELLRVTKGRVAGSFWDAGTLEAWSHRMRLARRPRHRVTHSRRTIEAAVRAAGGRVLRWRPTLGRLSQQVWFLCEREA